MDDLRQMFAYHHYFDAVKCYLLFPGKADLQEGSFTNVSYFKKSDLGEQMFAYHHYFDAVKCYLLFPGKADLQEGSFTNVSYFKKSDLGEKACGIIVSDAWVSNEGKGFLNKEIGVNILKGLGLIGIRA
ncbi:hypothetical protein [Arcticibacter eurypsychrophilus]|uniref:hypothetical protein n=1 Tax=Arcticibacter eurypsychrophilus TaxID=1434752 RepID=UPI00084D850F|nr:hypothetical protein [Arcticibacter eurypsychrophilus]